MSNVTLATTTHVHTALTTVCDLTSTSIPSSFANSTVPVIASSLPVVSSSAPIPVSSAPVNSTSSASANSTSPASSSYHHISSNSSEITANGAAANGALLGSVAGAFAAAALLL